MSTEPVRKITEHQFGRLMYKNQQMQVHDPASTASIASFITKGEKIELSLYTNNIDPEQKDLYNKSPISSLNSSFIPTATSTTTHSRLRSVELKNASLVYADHPICQLTSFRDFLYSCQTQFLMIASLSIMCNTAS